jgi:phage terminase large subunit GpA-like protein
MFPINCFAIDSGYATTEVYEWARKQGNKVLVVKGDVRAEGVLGAASPVDVGPHGTKSKYGIKVWPVNSGMAKEELYRWLKLERPTDEDLEKGVAFPPGYCHFPKYSEEYFKQITAEQLVTKTVKGYRRTEWQKMRERNEALDCRVYARAAAAHLGMDRFQDHHWEKIEQNWKNSIEQERLRQSRGPEPPQPRQSEYRESWFRPIRGRFNLD